MSNIRIKKAPFSVVPDSIMEDKRMRLDTRLVLGWLIGRPNDWVVHVGYVQYTLGLSERRWVTIRKELQAMGYLRQIRRRNEDGKFVWEHIVSDTPMLSDPKPPSNDNAIPTKQQDGSKSQKAIPPKTMDGSAMHGECGDITTTLHQKNINTPSPYPFPRKILLSSACLDEAQERFKGYSVSALEFEWREAMEKRGEPPKNPDKAFLGWAEIYVKNHPLPYGGKF